MEVKEKFEKLGFRREEYGFGKYLKNGTYYPHAKYVFDLENIGMFGYMSLEIVPTDMKRDNYTIFKVWQEYNKKGQVKRKSEWHEIRETSPLYSLITEQINELDKLGTRG